MAVEAAGNGQGAARTPVSDAWMPVGAKTFAELRELVREDYERHGRSFWSAGFQALAVHRFGAWLLVQPPMTRRLLRRFYTMAFTFVRNVYGIDIPAKAHVGRRLLIGHGHGIDIHPHSIIGDDCVFRHNLTLGAGGQERDGFEAGPRLGNHVRTGPCVTLLGGVTVGDDARIGPNCLVISDVPAGATVFATPGRTLGMPPKSRPESTATESAPSERP
jgi:serine O-acetyltransferase